jgi:hypothetical protein
MAGGFGVWFSWQECGVEEIRLNKGQRDYAKRRKRKGYIQVRFCTLLSDEIDSTWSQVRI